MIRDKEFNDDELLRLLTVNAIDRNKVLVSFMKALNTVKGNAFLSVDATWGSGKTVFAKQLQYLNFCDQSEVSQILDSEVVSEYQQKYVVFYYNAWENDYHEDPLQSLLFSLLNKFYSDIRFKDKAQAITKSILNSVIKEGVKTLTKGIVDIEQLQNAPTMKDLVEQISAVEERKAAVSKIIHSILPEGKKLLFVIDELDRCNPKFAVNTMEVMKHYYNDDDIVFVLSTNNRQLVHTVKKYYGSDFDGYAYLDKFYDVVFDLPKIDANEYLTNHLNVSDDEYYINLVPREISKHLNLTMREINRYYSSFSLIMHSLDSQMRNQYFEFSLVNYVLIPLALALKVKNIDSYDKLMTGEGGPIIRSLIENSDSIKRMLGRLNESEVDISEFAIVTYKRLISYEDRSREQSSYNLREAGRHLENALPLISMVNKLDA
jgi:hypothetical protein